MKVNELINYLEVLKEKYGNIEVIMEVEDILEPIEEARTSLVGSIDGFHIGEVDGYHFICMTNMKDE